MHEANWEEVLGFKPTDSNLLLRGASAPAFAPKALDFVNGSLGLSMKLREVAIRADFIPDPFRPVPPGRIPVSSKWPIQQADFFDKLPDSLSREIKID